jgi:SnoaL-like polyketide cyclase
LLVRGAQRLQGQVGRLGDGPRSRCAAKPGAWAQFFGLVHQAFPDLHAEVHEVIAEGDLVAAWVTYTGTPRGEFVGIPATGSQTTISGVDWFRMQDGRQAEHWAARTCSASWSRLASCPDQAHQDQAPPPSTGRQQLTGARPVTDASRTRPPEVLWPPA